MTVRRFAPERLLEQMGGAAQSAVERVLASGRYIGGDEVALFEREVCSHLGCKHAISCASGTDGIELALRSLQLAPGSFILAPSFTFTATASAVVAAGMRPLFVDIDPETLQISPASLRAAVGAGPAAVVVVSLCGAPLRSEIFDVADKAGIPVIEDACQSFGAGFGEERSGTRASLTAFSFFPGKPLSCFGDGGLVATEDSELAGRVRALANHGFSGRRHHPMMAGRNSRLDAIQAAVLRAKLPFVETWRLRRKTQAARYHAAFSGVLQIPSWHEHHAWALYTIQTPDRASLFAWLEQSDIDSSIFYPRGLHRTVAFRSSTCLPQTDDVAARCLSLPISATMSEAEQTQVIEAVTLWSERSNQPRSPHE